MKRLTIYSLLTILIFSTVTVFTLNKEGCARMSQYDLRGKVHAPELNGIAWLNVDQPLQWEDLEGKIVLLDFWTYCCINCIHVIAELKELEAKYPDELVVIGVHQAKFENEQEIENIRSAVLRNEIEHPVVVDYPIKSGRDTSLWSQYGARGWPHLVLVDPNAMIVGTLSGEGHQELLDKVIAGLIEKHEGSIKRGAIPHLSLEKNKEPETVLSFPGKVYADEESQRLFIADSNHNRIIVSNLDGTVLEIIGNGEEGMRDGAYQEAMLNHPQGMVLVGNHLFVADTENHTIRKIDLTKQTVETVAGNGEKGGWGQTGGDALSTPLNSPWDLVTRDDDEHIYIAMAGPHQIWRYDPASRTVAPFAGSGYENIVDGPIAEAQLAQPSGLTTDGTNIYFADSEVSALRMIDFQSEPKKVKTLVGKGLFEFGDVDGPFDQALMQHTLGVAYLDEKVYIADAYNHKIRVANLNTQELSTLAGTGNPGIGSSTQAQFYEPGGVSIAGESLYIADTNNHAIRALDLNSQEVRTVSLDLSEWKQKTLSNEFTPFNNKAVILDNRTVSPTGTVTITFDFPEGYHFNAEAKPTAQIQAIKSDDSEWSSAHFSPEVQGDNIVLPLEKYLEFDEQAKLKQLDIAITYYYCRDDNQGQCHIGGLWYQTDLNSNGGNLTIDHPVKNTLALMGD